MGSSEVGSNTTLRIKRNMIQGRGNSSSSIFFIGDIGSSDDLSSGLSLSGNSERILRQLCNNANLKLDDNYRTLLIKDYIKGFDFMKKIKQKTEALQAARDKIKPLSFEEILFEEIKAIQPKVLVPLGQMTLSLLTGAAPHSKFRGSILPTLPSISEKLGRVYKVIPTFSPQDINIDYTKFSIALVDFDKKISPESKYTEVPKDNSIIWVCRSGVEASNFFRRVKEAKPEFVSFDIETFQGIPTCISFCYDGRESVSFPLMDPSIDLANQVMLISEVARALNDETPKVAQNGKYDTIILERFGFNVRNFVGDTMLAFHTLYPELASRGGEEGTNKGTVGYGKNLGFLTSIYTSQPYFKDEGKKSQSFPPDLQHLTYNAKDSRVTHEIYSKELEELKELDLYQFYTERVMPLFFVYRGMETKGFRIDGERQKQLKAKYEVLLELETKDLFHKVGYGVNSNSNPQIGKLVYEELKFPKRVKRNTGAYDTEEETLEELAILFSEDNKAGKEGRDILYGILACRKLRKCLEYIETPIHPDGRLRSSWNIAGTETGRTSGGKSADSIIVSNGSGKFESVKLGRSLQTITKHGFKVGDTTYGKDLRTMYVASHGCILIEGDQSQAEARHVAVLANDSETLALLEKKEFKRNKYGVKDDLHTITATWVTDLPFEEITERMRQEDGKPARHGGAYGMSPKRFALMYHKSLEYAVKVLDKFHKNSPKIRGVFWEEIRHELQNKRCLRNPFGRRRDFLGRIDEDMYKEGYAYIPQGTVSDHQKFGMVRMSRLGKDWIAFLVEAHDSTLAEVPIACANEYRDIFIREMNVPIYYGNCSLSRDFELKVPVDLSIGENWGCMNPFK